LPPGVTAGAAATAPASSTKPLKPGECPDATGPIAGPIVFGAGNTLKAMHADGSNVTDVFDIPSTFWAHEPAWSPDGQTLAFTLSSPSSDPKLNGLQVGMICAVERASGKSRLLLQGKTPTDSVDEAAWTPDGHALLVTMRHTKVEAGKGYAGETVELARFELASGTTQTLVNGALSPAPSPDGQRLAYLRIDEQTGVGDLALARADGQKAQLISEPQTPFSAIFTPRWAPDSSRVIFTASGGVSSSQRAPNERTLLERLLGVSVARAHGAPADLWLVDRDGKNPRNLTNKGLDDPRAAWSPDGKALLHTAGSAGGVYLLDLATNQERQLTEEGDYGGIAWAAR
jgi:Tol biopolymer transport system component